MRFLTLVAIIFLWVAINPLSAQPLNESTYEQIISQARSTMKKGDYYTSVEFYKDAYDERPSMALADTIAMLYYKLRDYRRAERYFERLFRRDDRNQYNHLRFYYGKVQKMQGEYQEARVAFNEFIGTAEDPDMIAKARLEIQGIEMARGMEAKQGVVVENAGDEVNTRGPEESAVLYNLDEMYYSTFNSNSKITRATEDEEYDEDDYARIFVSKRGEDEWQEGKPLDDKINRKKYNNSNAVFSPDGQRMYFTRAKLYGEELTESKIFLSYRSGDEWSPPRELTGVNGDFISRHPAVGELFGNEVLFFVSNMEGGQGGYDIYYAEKTGEYEYDFPVNLGPGINTSQDELSPYFIDGKLYFSTEGYPTIGGLDVFSSTWDGSSWSNPENIGKPYNSYLDDYQFSIDADGVYGMLLSNRPGTESFRSETCCDDIYSIYLDEILVDVVVEVFDEEKNPLEGAEVTLWEVANNRIVNSETKQNMDSNQLVFNLLRERAYYLIAGKDGYDTDTIQFNTVGIRRPTSLKKEMYIAKEEPEYETYTIEEPIRLNNIYYDFDEAKILPEAEKDLRLLLELLDQYPNMIIELSSHTDARGDDAYNKDLSQRRANSAKEWLVERGVDEDRIQAVGYGETQILNKCKNGVPCSEEEHRINRRTEFKILEGPTSIKIEKTRLRGAEDKKDEDDIDPDVIDDNSFEKKK